MGIDTVGFAVVDFLQVEYVLLKVLIPFKVWIRIGELQKFPLQLYQGDGELKLINVLLLRKQLEQVSPPVRESRVAFLLDLFLEVFSFAEVVHLDIIKYKSKFGQAAYVNEFVLAQTIR